MGIADNAKNEGQNMSGKAKEAVGRARGDRPLENKGKREQTKSQMKKAGANIKKAFKK